jgi:hypothetical protein
MRHRAMPVWHLHAAVQQLCVRHYALAELESIGHGASPI